MSQNRLVVQKKSGRMRSHSKDQKQLAPALSMLQKSQSNNLLKYQYQNNDKRKGLMVNQKTGGWPSETVIQDHQSYQDPTINSQTTQKLPPRNALNRESKQGQSQNQLMQYSSGVGPANASMTTSRTKPDSKLPHNHINFLQKDRQLITMVSAESMKQNQYNNVTELVSSDGAYSYIDAPPLPFRKKYRVDLCNKSAESMPFMTSKGLKNRQRSQIEHSMQIRDPFAITTTGNGQVTHLLGASRQDINLGSNYKQSQLSGIASLIKNPNKSDWQQIQQTHVSDAKLGLSQTSSNVLVLQQRERDHHQQLHSSIDLQNQNVSRAIAIESQATTRTMHRANSNNLGQHLRQSNSVNAQINYIPNVSPNRSRNSDGGYLPYIQQSMSAQHGLSRVVSNNQLTNDHSISKTEFQDDTNAQSRKLKQSNSHHQSSNGRKSMPPLPRTIMNQSNNQISASQSQACLPTLESPEVEGYSQNSIYKNNSLPTLNQNGLHNQDQTSVLGGLINGSMPDTCTKITIQSLCQAFQIDANTAYKFILETRDAVLHFRKQIPMTKHQLNSKLEFEGEAAEKFFSLLSEKFLQKSEQIVQSHADLRPVFNMILVGMQTYQPEKTRIEAIQTLLYISMIEEHRFRSKVWHWAKYTSIKPSKGGNTGRGQVQRQSLSKFAVQGFFQSCINLIEMAPQSGESQLSCYLMLLVSESNLLELFLNQLTSLFTERHQYLRMILERFHLFIEQMEKYAIQQNEGATISLVEVFYTLGIPSFLVFLCQLLIDQNITFMQEASIKQFTNQLTQKKEIAQRKQTLDQYLLAIDLLIELWVMFPQIFSQPQKTNMLRLDTSQQDFGLQQKLDQLANQVDPLQKGQQKALGQKILKTFKKLSSESSVTFRFDLLTKMFYLLDTLTEQNSPGDKFPTEITSLLTFFMLEWFDEKTLRHPILENFKQLIELMENKNSDNYQQSFNFDQLIEPACQVILHNLQTKQVPITQYLDLNDFNFFQFIAWRQNLPLKSALSICEVMSLYMLKPEAIGYKTIAEKIFYKLVSLYIQIDSMQQLMQRHVEMAVEELLQAESQIQNLNDDQMQTSMFASDQTKTSVQVLNCQIQLHYLFKHLVRLTKSNFSERDDEQQQQDVASMFSHAYSSVSEKIFLSILTKGNEQGQRSSILDSLIRKLAQSFRTDGQEISQSYQTNGVDFNKEMNGMSQMQREQHQKSIEIIDIERDDIGNHLLPNHESQNASRMNNFQDKSSLDAEYNQRSMSSQNSAIKEAKQKDEFELAKENMLSFYVKNDLQTTNETQNTKEFSQKPTSSQEPQNHFQNHFVTQPAIINQQQNYSQESQSNRISVPQESKSSGLVQAASHQEKEYESVAHQIPTNGQNIYNPFRESSMKKSTMELVQQDIEQPGASMEDSALKNKLSGLVASPNITFRTENENVTNIQNPQMLAQSSDIQEPGLHINNQDQQSMSQSHDRSVPVENNQDARQLSLVDKLPYTHNGIAQNLPEQHGTKTSGIQHQSTFHSSTIDGNSRGDGEREHLQDQSEKPLISVVNLQPEPEQHPIKLLDSQQTKSEYASKRKISLKQRKVTHPDDSHDLDADRRRDTDQSEDGLQTPLVYDQSGNLKNGKKQKNVLIKQITLNIDSEEGKPTMPKRSEHFIRQEIEEKPAPVSAVVVEEVKMQTFSPLQTKKTFYKSGQKTTDEENKNEIAGVDDKDDDEPRSVSLKQSLKSSQTELKISLREEQEEQEPNDKVDKENSEQKKPSVEKQQSRLRIDPESRASQCTTFRTDISSEFARTTKAAKDLKSIIKRPRKSDKDLSLSVQQPAQQLKSQPTSVKNGNRAQNPQGTQKKHQYKTKCSFCDANKLPGFSTHDTEQCPRILGKLLQVSTLSSPQQNPQLQQQQQKPESPSKSPSSSLLRKQTQAGGILLGLNNSIGKRSQYHTLTHLPEITSQGTNEPSQGSSAKQLKETEEIKINNQELKQKLKVKKVKVKDKHSVPPLQLNLHRVEPSRDSQPSKSTQSNDKPFPQNLPKMNDFWRNKPLSQSFFNQSLPKAAVQQNHSPIQLQRHRTQNGLSPPPVFKRMQTMSQADDEEMTEAFRRHNAMLKMQQEIMRKRAAEIQSSLSQLSPDSPIRMKSGFSKLLSNINNDTNSQFVQPTLRIVESGENMSSGLDQDRYSQTYRSLHKRDEEDDKYPNDKEDLPEQINIAEEPEAISVNGKIVDLNHPDLNKLTPFQQRDLFQLLDNNMKTMDSEDRNKLSKLIYQMEHGKPLDAKHPNIKNLTPTQQRLLAQYLQLRDRSSVIEALQNLQNLLLNGFELGTSHPGFKSFESDEQELFSILHKFVHRGEILDKQDQLQYEKMLDIMQNEEPFDDQEYYGLQNLEQQELEQLRTLIKKINFDQNHRHDNDIEISQFNQLVRKIRPYKKYDSSNLFICHLNISQLQQFQQILQKKARHDELSRDETIKFNDYCTLMNFAMPLEKVHQGYQFLTPIEKERFEYLLKQNIFQPEALRSKEVEEFQSLLQLMMDQRAQDQQHVGFSTQITSEMQDQFRRLISFIASNKQLSEQEHKTLCYIQDQIQNGRPMDVKHPGLKFLPLNLQSEFKSLKANEKNLSPIQVKRLGKLSELVLPSFFTQEYKDQFQRLSSAIQAQRGDMNYDQWKRINYLAEMKRKMPDELLNVLALTPEERENLNYLLRLKADNGFQPLAKDKQNELDNLVDRCVKQTDRLSEDESDELLKLVKQLHSGQNLTSQQEGRLDELHKKQMKVLGGGLTANQLENFEKIEQINDPSLLNLKEFLQKLKIQPDLLRQKQREEYQILASKRKDGEILSPDDRTKLMALERIKYYKQLFSPEDQLLLFLMKELEFEDEVYNQLTSEDKATLFKLQEYFGVLPPLSEEELLELGGLLTMKSTKTLDDLEDQQRLQSLNNRQRHFTNKYPTLTEEEGIELAALRSRDQKELPKIYQQRLEELEIKAGLRKATNRAGTMVINQITMSQSQKRPKTVRADDDLSETDTEDSEGDNLILSAKPNSEKEHQEMKRNFAKMIDENFIAKLTLKKVIKHYYNMECRNLINDYNQSLKKAFNEAKSIDKYGKKNAEFSSDNLSKDQFLAYCRLEKVSFENIDHPGLLKDFIRDSFKITLKAFIKLLLVVSCAAKKNKIGDSNFIKLMKHMELPDNVELVQIEENKKNKLNISTKKKKRNNLDNSTLSKSSKISKASRLSKNKTDPYNSKRRGA